MEQGLVIRSGTVSPLVNANAIEELKRKSHADVIRPLVRPVTPLRLPGFNAHNAKQNQIINSLPIAEYEHLLPYLELIPMPLNMVVCEGNDQIQYVYFPTNSIVSFLYETQDGASAETAVVGYEGLVGITTFMGGGPMQCRAVVKSAGYGFRIKASILKDEFGRSTALQKVLLHYAQALFLQASQMAVCNRHHNIVQQLCRMLLLCLDRLSSNEIFMNQESIASMLGVRRESVTLAAAKLQEEGLIQYRRGHITVNHRKGLEQRVCECYCVVKKEYDHLAHNCKSE